MLVTAYNHIVVEQSTLYLTNQSEEEGQAIPNKSVFICKMRVTCFIWPMGQLAMIDPIYFTYEGNVYCKLYT